MKIAVKNLPVICNVIRDMVMSRSQTPHFIFLYTRNQFSTLVNDNFSHFEGLRSDTGLDFITGGSVTQPLSILLANTNTWRVE